MTNEYKPALCQEKQLFERGLLNGPEKRAIVNESITTELLLEHLEYLGKGVVKKWTYLKKKKFLFQLDHENAGNWAMCSSDYFRIHRFLFSDFKRVPAKKKFSNNAEIITNPTKIIYPWVPVETQA